MSKFERLAEAEEQRRKGGDSEESEGHSDEEAAHAQARLDERSYEEAQRAMSGTELDTDQVAKDQAGRLHSLGALTSRN